jgi:7-cyano-7-deazaguanine reductase
MKRAYTEEHARAGLQAPLPSLETFPNQFRDYEIEIVIPEFTSVCPKTGQPDFGTIRVTYVPDRRCVELKSLKLYLQAYRDKGIFYEDVVNVILDDLVAAMKPRRLTVEGEFRVRGGISTVVTASYEAPARGPGRRK